MIIHEPKDLSLVAPIVADYVENELAQLGAYPISVRAVLDPDTGDGYAFGKIKVTVEATFDIVAFLTQHNNRNPYTSR